MLIIQKIIITLLIVLPILAAWREFLDRKISGANGLLLVTCMMLCFGLSVIGFFVAWYNTTFFSAVLYFVAYAVWTYFFPQLLATFIVYLDKRLT